MQPPAWSIHATHRDAGDRYRTGAVCPFLQSTWLEHFSYRPYRLGADRSEELDAAFRQEKRHLANPSRDTAIGKMLYWPPAQASTISRAIFAIRTSPSLSGVQLLSWFSSVNSEI